MKNSDITKFTSDDWMTPPEIIQALGPFDLDPCSPARPPWVIAGQYYSLADDGLVRPWFGRVFCNPPYSLLPNRRSRVELWMRVMAEHANGYALTNACTDTQWFLRHICDVAYAMFFFEGRLRFWRPDGTKGRRSDQPSMIAAYTEADAAQLYRAGFKGKFIPLVLALPLKLTTTWRKLVRSFLQECGGVATLEQLYELAAGHPKLAKNRNWQAKIRQAVQREGERIGRGQWRLAGES